MTTPTTEDKLREALRQVQVALGFYAMAWTFINDDYGWESSHEADADHGDKARQALAAIARVLGTEKE